MSHLVVVMNGKWIIIVIIIVIVRISNAIVSICTIICINITTTMITFSSSHPFRGLGLILESIEQFFVLLST